MEFDYKQTIEYLASMGAELATGTMGNRGDTTYKFYYNLTLSLAIEIAVSPTGNWSHLQSDELGSYTMACPTFSDSFGLHDFLRTLPKYNSFTKLKNSVKAEYLSWLKVYGEKYTFKQFQEAIRQDIACSYVIPLAYELNKDSKKYGVSNVVLHYKHPFDNILAMFSRYEGRLSDTTPAELLQMDTVCDLLHAVTIIPELTIYCRKVLIDKLLTDL